MELHGQVAVVTGAAVGIGRGICLSLAERGAAVVGLDIDAAGNEETAALVRGSGVDGVALTCDVGDRQALSAAIADTEARFGRIDVLVNNAAVWLDSSLTGGDFEMQCVAFARSLDSCVVGAFYCAAAAVPVMRRNGGGNIVNIITDHVKEGHLLTGGPATGYDCAKFGLWRLTETWAVELATHGIRVNGLCFGATDTPMLRAVSVPLAEAAMRPADIGQAVLNILAHGPGGPTGQSPLFGLTGAPRETSLQEIAALGPPS